MVGVFRDGTTRKFTDITVEEYQNMQHGAKGSNVISFGRYAFSDKTQIHSDLKYGQRIVILEEQGKQTCQVTIKTCGREEYSHRDKALKFKQVWAERYV
mmetsp:Transcript_64899/g.201028  ORF Transcript_64899/g.201028 Transcript_64899/m.201028 type:complete len:99 (+) Transcript_64899:572-868(+)